MKELYIIVHEKSVARSVGVSDRPSAPSVLDEIKKVKSLHQFISHDEEPIWLNDKMPAPSEDLRIFVAGGFRELCVAIHKELLGNAGYNAEFYEPACLVLGNYPL